MDIFREQNYKQFLTVRILAYPAKGHGIRSELAKFLGCQTSYLSRVLNGDAHLSLEQALAAAHFFELNQEETQYLLLLVQVARAGNHDLVRHFQAQLDQLSQKRLSLKERLAVSEALSPEDHNIYFSSWYYSAVHALVSIPRYQELAELAKRLQITRVKTKEILDFLLSRGLIKKEKDRYLVGTRRLHLSAQSSLVSRHHTNWRMRAIHSLDSGREQDLHYSSVVTCTEQDALKIKTLMVETIEKIRANIKAAKDEELFSYSFDLFKA
jgi:uncharacterized protein (TIGR02147 family)